jgi:hypothetical protein
MNPLMEEDYRRLIKLYIQNEGQTKSYFTDISDKIVLANPRHPYLILKAYELYNFKVICYEKDMLYENEIWKQKRKLHFKINRHFDNVALNIMKKAKEIGRCPLSYKTPGIIYMGVNTNKNGLDQWYIGKTNGTWLSRHYNIDSGWSTHSTHVALATLGLKPRTVKDGFVIESNVQLCDYTYSLKGGNTRFYLIWKVDKDAAKENTCEFFFMEYLRDSLNSIIPIDKKRIDGDLSRYKFDKIEYQHYGSLNNKLELGSDKSELEILNKLFGTSINPKDL